MAEPEFRWTQDEWGDEALGPPSGWPSVRGWAVRHSSLFRLLIVAGGSLLFELTADTAVASAVGCLEFGRTDFGTALWLRKHDPHPVRKSICLECYLIWGLLRVAVMSSLVLLTIVIGAILIDIDKLGLIGPLANLFKALWVTGLTLVLASGLALKVTITAWRIRARIWLGPEPLWARQQGVWPPSMARPRRESHNQGKQIITLACFAAGLTLFVVVAFVCPHIPEKVWPRVFFGSCVLIVAMLTTGVSFLERRVLAVSPAEFWPLEESAIATPS